MYLGRLVEIAPASEIYKRPAHPYTAGLLEAIPLPNPILARRKKQQIAVRGELPSPTHPPSGCRFRTRCPRAQERCAEEIPALRRFGNDHLAACHFPLQAPAVRVTSGPVG
jgi:oligopeptide/dipeptide ABC transporter ATP-binding protein